MTQAQYEEYLNKEFNIGECTPEFPTHVAVEDTTAKQRDAILFQQRHMIASIASQISDRFKELGRELTIAHEIIDQDTDIDTDVVLSKALNTVKCILWSRTPEADRIIKLMEYAESVCSSLTSPDDIVVRRIITAEKQAMSVNDILLDFSTEERFIDSLCYALGVVPSSIEHKFKTHYIDWPAREVLAWNLGGSDKPTHIWLESLPYYQTFKSI